MILLILKLKPIKKLIFVYNIKLHFNIIMRDYITNEDTIIFSPEFNKPLNNLPKAVELLVLPRYYNIQIINIPQKLKIIICSKDYKFIDNFANFKVETY